MNSAFPQLITPRLTLRKIDISDAKQVAHSANDKEIHDNTRSFPFPYSEKDAKNFIDFQEEMFLNRKGVIFGIYIEDPQKFIGAIGIDFSDISGEAEIGYWLDKSYRNLGISTEALKEIIDYSFNNLNLNKLFATHYLYNPASGQVLMKTGFRKIGIRPGDTMKNNKCPDVMYYELNREQFFEI